MKKGKKSASSTPVTRHQKTDLNRSDADQGLLLNISSEGKSIRERPFLVEYFPTAAQARAERRARANELDQQQRIAKTALRQLRGKWTDELKESGQVAAINVAYRTKLGQIVAPLQYVIRIDVERKFPKDALKVKDLVEFPREVEVEIRKKKHYVPTKVRQIRLTNGNAAFSRSAGNATGNFDTEPIIKGGIAISSSALPNKFGTVGICVPDASGLIGVTNSHVAGALADPAPSIIQPPKSPTSIVGTVIDSILGNLIDGASFRGTGTRPFEEGIKGLPYPGPDYMFLRDDNLSASKFSDLDFASVLKFGHESSKTTGMIAARSTDSLPVHDLAPSVFNHVIEVSSDHLFLDGGDSGSVLIYEDVSNGEIVPVVLGLNFASTDDGLISYAIPFGTVISELNLSIAEPRLWPR